MGLGVYDSPELSLVPFSKGSPRPLKDTRCFYMRGHIVLLFDSGKIGVGTR